MVEELRRRARGAMFASRFVVLTLADGSTVEGVPLRVRRHGSVRMRLAAGAFATIDLSRVTRLEVRP